MYISDLGREINILLICFYLIAYTKKPFLKLIFICYLTLKKTMKQLIRYSSPKATECTIFYTVWSYGGGYGRLILNYLLPILNTNRYVTLSPRTDMAVRFHTRNGAKMIGDNEESYNFEYYK